MSTKFHGDENHPSVLVDPVNISTSKYSNERHNSDIYKSLKAGLPKFKKRESDLTDEFYKSLQVSIPDNEVKLVKMGILKTRTDNKH